MKQLLKFLRKYFTVIPKVKQLDPKHREAGKGLVVGIRIEF